MILLGVKVGVYALLRFYLSCREAVEQWQYAVVGLHYWGILCRDFSNWATHPCGAIMYLSY